MWRKIYVVLYLLTYQHVHCSLPVWAETGIQLLVYQDARVRLFRAILHLYNFGEMQESRGAPAKKPPPDYFL